MKSIFGYTSAGGSEVKTFGDGGKTLKRVMGVTFVRKMDSQLEFVTWNLDGL